MIAKQPYIPGTPSPPTQCIDVCPLQPDTITVIVTGLTGGPDCAASNTAGTTLTRTGPTTCVWVGTHGVATYTCQCTQNAPEDADWWLTIDTAFGTSVWMRPTEDGQAGSYVHTLHGAPCDSTGATVTITH